MIKTRYWYVPLFIVLDQFSSVQFSIYFFSIYFFSFATLQSFLQSFLLYPVFRLSLQVKNALIFPRNVLIVASEFQKGGLASKVKKMEKWKILLKFSQNRNSTTINVRFFTFPSMRIEHCNSLLELWWMHTEGRRLSPQYVRPICK